MKKITVLLFIFCATQVFSQDVKKLKESAMRDSQAACKATLNEDFKTLLTYTHPNIINAAGGTEVMEEFLVSTFNQMKAGGFKYEIAETKSVSDVVKEQGELGSGDEEVAQEVEKQPAKRATRKKLLENQEADLLTEAFLKMSIESPSHSMEFKCPHIMCDHVEHGCQCVSIDFLVPNQHQQFFAFVCQTIALWS